MMNVPRLVLLAALTSGTACGAVAEGQQPEGTDRQAVLRLDPMAGQLVPVSAQERKTGHIYRHFSPHLNRWVWAFYHGGERFSFALGAGSLQPAHRLDLPAAAAKDEGKKAGWAAATTLAEAVSDPDNRGVYARLNNQDQWELYGPFGIPSVLDAESGSRWESHGGRYVPISHARGYRWVVHGERYAPMSDLPPTGCFPGMAAGY
jgi:hypothetical protein